MVARSVSPVAGALVPTHVGSRASPPEAMDTSEPVSHRRECACVVLARLRRQRGRHALAVQRWLLPSGSWRRRRSAATAGTFWRFWPCSSRKSCRGAPRAAPQLLHLPRASRRAKRAGERGVHGARSAPAASGLWCVTARRGRESAHGMPWHRARLTLRRLRATAAPRATLDNRHSAGRHHRRVVPLRAVRLLAAPRSRLFRCLHGAQVRVGSHGAVLKDAPESFSFTFESNAPHGCPLPTAHCPLPAARSLSFTAATHRFFLAVSVCEFLRTVSFLATTLPSPADHCTPRSPRLAAWPSG
jgi:hypothetical protein